jgi:serine/threonine protein kinase
MGSDSLITALTCVVCVYVLCMHVCVCTRCVQLDLKCDNVFVRVDNDGKIKRLALGDFGMNLVWALTCFVFCVWIITVHSRSCAHHHHCAHCVALLICVLVCLRGSPVDTAKKLTKTTDFKTIIGTPSFMAPEVLNARETGAYSFSADGVCCLSHVLV